MPMASPPQPNQLAIAQAQWRTTLNFAARIFAARIIVFLGVAGGIALACIALPQPDQWRLGVLLIYAIGVVWPTVWLAGSSK